MPHRCERQSRLTDSATTLASCLRPLSPHLGSLSISAVQALGDPDLGNTYYRHWLAALEALVSAKGASSPEELGCYQQAWQQAADRVQHGQPIELRERDFAH